MPKIEFKGIGRIARFFGKGESKENKYQRLAKKVEKSGAGSLSKSERKFFEAFEANREKGYATVEEALRERKKTSSDIKGNTSETKQTHPKKSSDTSKHKTSPKNTSESSHTSKGTSNHTEDIPHQKSDKTSNVNKSEKTTSKNSQTQSEHFWRNGLTHFASQMFWHPSTIFTYGLAITGLYQLLQAEANGRSWTDQILGKVAGFQTDDELDEKGRPTGRKVVVGVNGLLTPFAHALVGTKAVDGVQGNKVANTPNTGAIPEFLKVLLGQNNMNHLSQDLGAVKQKVASAAGAAAEDVSDIHQTVVDGAKGIKSKVIEYNNGSTEQVSSENEGNGYSGGSVEPNGQNLNSNHYALDAGATAALMAYSFLGKSPLMRIGSTLGAGIMGNKTYNDYKQQRQQPLQSEPQESSLNLTRR